MIRVKQSDLAQTNPQCFSLSGVMRAMATMISVTGNHKPFFVCLFLVNDIPYIVFAHRVCVHLMKFFFVCVTVCVHSSDPKNPEM